MDSIHQAKVKSGHLLHKIALVQSQKNMTVVFDRTEFTLPHLLIFGHTQNRAFAMVLTGRKPRSYLQQFSSILTFFMLNSYFQFEPRHKRLTPCSPAENL